MTASSPAKAIARSDTRVPMLLSGLGAAVVLRAAVAGRAGPASPVAAASFAAAILTLCLAGGWRPGRLRVVHLLVGAGAGLLFAAGPLVLHGALPAEPSVGMAAWTVLVTCVAVAEECLLRGALWDASDRCYGTTAALVLTTVAFAVMHAPLYGWRAVPLDIGVGLGLGALRVWSGGVSAPAAAHVVADLIGGWL